MSSDGSDTSDLLWSVDVITEQNFGDHAERVRLSHEAVPGESIEDLILRVFPALTERFRSHNPADVIEIRAQLPRCGQLPDLTPPDIDPDMPPF